MSVNQLRGETLQTCIDSHDGNAWNAAQIKVVGPQETAEPLRTVGFIFTVHQLQSRLCSSCFRGVHPSFKEEFKAVFLPRETDRSIRVSFNLKASESPEKLWHWRSFMHFYLDNLVELTRNIYGLSNLCSVFGEGVFSCFYQAFLFPGCGEILIRHLKAAVKETWWNKHRNRPFAQTWRRCDGHCQLNGVFKACVDDVRDCVADGPESL